MRHLNPLFSNERLAHFDIDEFVDDAIQVQLAQQAVDFKRFETEIAAVEAPTFADVVERLERISFPLNRTYEILYHVSNVMDRPCLRETKQRYIEQLTELGELVSKSPALFDALQRIDRRRLTETEARIVELDIDSMRKNGFGLDPEGRAELLRLDKRMTEVSMKFAENAADAAKAVYAVRPEHTAVVAQCPEFATNQWRVEGKDCFEIG